MFKFLRALLNRFLTDNISFLAGGVAFYGMLALFPALAGIVSLFGLFASANVVNQQLETVQLLFPPEVFKIIQDQLFQLTAQSHATLSLTVVISLLITIYSATKGTNAMLAALNSVFRITETRNWFRQQITAYSLTFGALLLMIFTIFIVIAIPLIIHFLPDYILMGKRKWIESLRWLILACAVFTGLFILFCFGPSRPVDRKCLRSIFWGAFVATAMWIAASVFGSILIQFYPSVNAAYGSLSAIVFLLMWIYVSAYTVLIGGAITAEAEEVSHAGVSSFENIVQESDAASRA
jgi:membrane protein